MNIRCTTIIVTSAMHSHRPRVNGNAALNGRVERNRKRSRSTGMVTMAFLVKKTNIFCMVRGLQTPNYILDYTRAYNLFWVKPLRSHCGHCHPDNCHQTTSTRTTATQDNCHPGQSPHRTTATLDNRHPGIVTIGILRSLNLDIWPPQGSGV